jgi:hypothetical protein
MLGDPHDGPVRSPNRIILCSDPDYDPENAAVEFRLTYEGRLMGASKNNTRAKHKHEVRRVFHAQLKNYWQTHPYLKVATRSDPIRGQVNPTQALSAYLAEQYERVGYNFVPLVTPELSLNCGIDVLFLRPSMPGQIMQSGDIDARLKTLFDALRVPTDKSELGGYDTPLENEKPFYCLLADDKLVGHVSVTTDTLLQPTSPDAGPNDARLVISVRLRPFTFGWHNISFG